MWNTQIGQQLCYIELWSGDISPYSKLSDCSMNYDESNVYKSPVQTLCFFLVLTLKYHFLVGIFMKYKLWSGIITIEAKEISLPSETTA